MTLWDNDPRGKPSEGASVLRVLRIILRTRAQSLSRKAPSEGEVSVGGTGSVAQRRGMPLGGGMFEGLAQDARRHSLGKHSQSKRLGLRFLCWQGYAIRMKWSLTVQREVKESRIKGLRLCVTHGS